MNILQLPIDFPNLFKNLYKLDPMNPAPPVTIQFLPLNCEIKELIDSKQFGDILWMRGRYGKSVEKNFDSGWRANKKYAGGGILMVQGLHMLDLMLHFCNDFQEVKAFASNLYWRGEIEDNVFAILKKTHNSKNILIEKHVKLPNSKGPDASSSIEVKRFSEMISSIRTIEKVKI